MGVSNKIENAIKSAGISTRDWWTTKAPENSENKQMVQDSGFEVNRGNAGSFDMYSDIYDVNLHNNEAGRHIKGFTFDQKSVVAHYDNGQVDKKFPLIF